MEVLKLPLVMERIDQEAEVAHALVKRVTMVSYENQPVLFAVKVS